MNSSAQTYKELAIPHFKEVFNIIDEVLTEQNTPYYLIGANAIALEFLRKGEKPPRGTKDIDFAIMISSFKKFEEISTVLISKGFRTAKAPWTFFYEKENVAIDILPFGEIEENDTIDFNKRYSDLHVLGFKEVLEKPQSIQIDDKIAQIPPLPGMVLLKLIAWSDRPEDRENDLSDILKIIQTYYDLEFDEIVDQHYDLLDVEDLDELRVAAEVLGRNAKVYLSKSVNLEKRIQKILNNELEKAVDSKIALDWARKLDKDLDYAFSLISAFQKGIS